MQFSDEQIKIMQAEYGKINKIDVSSDAYAKMVKLLNKMPQSMLKQLASSNVKFISSLAANRIKE